METLQDMKITAEEQKINNINQPRFQTTYNPRPISQDKPFQPQWDRRQPWIEHNYSKHWNQLPWKRSQPIPTNAFRTPWPLWNQRTQYNPRTFWNSNTQYSRNNVPSYNQIRRPTIGPSSYYTPRPANSYSQPPYTRQRPTMYYNNNYTRTQQPEKYCTCLLYTSPSPRDRTRSRMPSSA